MNYYFSFGFKTKIGLGFLFLPSQNPILAGGDTQYICMLDSDYFYRLGIPLHGSFFSSFLPLPPLPLSKPAPSPLKPHFMSLVINRLRIV